MNRWTTRFARAGNGGGLGPSGLTALAEDGRRRRGSSAPSADRPSRPASAIRLPSASAPKPMPERQSSSRRVSTASSRRGRGATSRDLDGAPYSIDEHEFVGQQQHLGELLPGRTATRRPCWDGPPSRRSSERRTAGEDSASPARRARATGEDATVEPARISSVAAGWLRPGLPSRVRGQPLACSSTNGLFIRKRACCGTVVTNRSRAGGVGHGEVEGAEEAVEVLAVDEAVDGPARRERRLGRAAPAGRPWSGRAARRRPGSRRASTRSRAGGG